MVMGALIEPRMWSEPILTGVVNFLDFLLVSLLLVILDRPLFHIEVRSQTLPYLVYLPVNSIKYGSRRLASKSSSPYMISSLLLFELNTLFFIIMHETSKILSCAHK